MQGKAGFAGAGLARPEGKLAILRAKSDSTIAERTWNMRPGDMDSYKVRAAMVAEGGYNRIPSDIRKHIRESGD